MTKLDNAILIATAAFEGETRDDGVTPAVVHAIETLTNLTEVAGIRDENVLIAGILHDVIEDAKDKVPGIERDIEYLYGPRVLKLVKEVTLPPHPTYEQKTGFMVNLMATGDIDAVIVKLADRLSNVRNMSGWKQARRDRYRTQTQAMLAVLSHRRIQADTIEADAINRLRSELWRTVLNP